MTTTAIITVYHYDSENAVYRRTVFPWAHLYYSRGAVLDKGLQRANEGVIRIPVSFDIELSIGDRIYKGALNADKPPAEGGMTVTAYSDNRRGANPHWRIDVK